MTKLDRHIYCPICGTALPTQSDGSSLSPEVMKLAPFCSSRCQLVDLSNWLGERYAVPGEPVTLEPEAPQSEQRDGTN